MNYSLDIKGRTWQEDEDEENVNSLYDNGDYLAAHVLWNAERKGRVESVILRNAGV